MAGNENKDRQVRKAEKPQRGHGTSADEKNSDPIAQALRNAYQSTIDEGVPDDFMDLIKKLD